VCARHTWPRETTPVLAAKVDEVSASSYVWAELRFAVQEPGVLTRLPKILTVLATLLLAILGVSAGTSPAAAHGNHSHQVITSSTGSDVLSRADIYQSRSIEAARSRDAAVPGLPDGHDKSDCCCGSLVCHAGVTLTVDVLPVHCPTGARVTAEPSSGRPQRDASGLERPPRTTYIA
jgi:hypothetical protein